MAILFPIVFSLLAGLLIATRTGWNLTAKQVMFGAGLLALILTTVNTARYSLEHLGQNTSPPSTLVSLN